MTLAPRSLAIIAAAAAADQLFVVRRPSVRCVD